MRLLRLRDGGWSYALDPGRVVALAGTAHLQRNPRRGGPCGWLLDTAEELPVFTLDGLAPDPWPHGGAPPGNAGRLPVRNGAGVVVVLTASDGPPFGLCVDACEGEQEVPRARLRPLPRLAASCSRHFSRVVMWDDALALELAGTHPEGPGRVPVREPMAGVDAAWPETAPASHRDLPPVSAAQSRHLALFTLPGAKAAEGAAGSTIVFGLPGSQIVEMTGGQALRPIPGARPPLLGLVGWREEPLAVLDLAGAVGLTHTPEAAPPRLLVARGAGARELVAFPVERVLGFAGGPFPQRPLPAPPFAGARGLRGAFADGLGRRLLVPDLDWLMSRCGQEPSLADHETAFPWR